MEVLQGLENVSCKPDHVITVGSFDGLHLGHQRIIQQMRKLELPVSLITFEPHPQLIVRRHQTTPMLLTSYNERLALFEKIGVNRLIILRFDSDFCELKARDFVENILVKKIGMAHIFVGPSHKFGKNRSGDVNILNQLSEQNPFEVHVVEPVKRFGKKISSSHVRKLLYAGDPLTAWRCLGRPYYLDGVVVDGDKRGKKLGFPTANLKTSEVAKIIPLSGIYASITEVDGIRWPSVSHLGPRPTFKGSEATIESHIIGFKTEIYGKQIRVGLIDRIRDILTFKSPSELIYQLSSDRRNSAQRLAELGFGNNARLRIQRYGKVLL